MNTVLWALQILLAVVFLASGGMKATQSAAALKEQAGERMAWVDDLTAGQLRAVGVVEVLGAIGLVLPPAVGIAPVLSPLAAAGLAVTMVGALALHVRRGDGPQAFAPNIVLGALAVFVAVQRFGPQAF